MKFLVLWTIDLGLLSQPMVRSIARMPDYGRDLERRGKVLARYHVVGAHGGAWIYEVDSHEEFENLLAVAPVFNFAHYDVRPLADMSGTPDVVGTDVVGTDVVGTDVAGTDVVGAGAGDVG